MNDHASRKANIFQYMAKLSQQYQAMDFGQGFQNFPPRSEILSLVKKRLSSCTHQYTSSDGHIELRKKLSNHYQARGLRFSHLDEITITCGAQEAICAGIHAFIRPQDEVLVFTPSYPFYFHSIDTAAGIAKEIHLGPDNKFSFNKNDLLEKISKKSKMIILNNPHNPTGKVFSKKELEIIAKVAREHNLLVLSDEVYEEITYGNHSFQSIATLDDMRDRTITISSLGKTFGITGWKTGYLLASLHLTREIRTQRSKYIGSTASPLQEMAVELFAPHFFQGHQKELKKTFHRKHKLVVQGLKEANLPFISPEGSFFILINIKELKQKDETDFQFCQRMVRDYQISLLPLSSFYKNCENSDYARLCFARDDQLLTEGMKRLKSLRQKKRPQTPPVHTTISLLKKNLLLLEKH